MLSRRSDSAALVIAVSGEDVLWLQLGGVSWEAADLAALTTAVATADTQRKDLWHTGCCCCCSRYRKYPQHIAKSTNIPHIPESVAALHAESFLCLIDSNENRYSKLSLSFCRVWNIGESAPFTGEEVIFFYLFRCISLLYFSIPTEIPRR